MEYGKIKIGDTVIFTDEGKRELGSVVDNKEHIVSRISENNDWEHGEFEDGSGSGVYWLFKIQETNERSCWKMKKNNK
jgi:hypothetical protein